MTIERIGTTARYSDIVIHHQTAYLVEVPTSEDTPITQQTREILTSFDTQLARIGSNNSRILSATIYLVDMADYDGMNTAWDAWFAPGTAPSRACIKVAGLARPGWRVEIALIAAV